MNSTAPVMALLQTHSKMGLKRHWFQTAVILLACWSVSAFSQKCFDTATDNGQIHYSNPLLQLHIDNFSISWNTSSTSSAQLAQTYLTYCESLKIANAGNTSFAFTRCYTNNSNCTDNSSYSITFHFISRLDTSTWQLSAVNYSDAGMSLVNCSDMSPSVSAKDWSGSGFYCGNISCSLPHGEVKLQQIWVQAFRSVSNGSSFLECGQSSSTNLLLNLGIGGAVGGAVSLAAAVIVIRFIYQRCQYGKYNLLNE